jgi:RNA-directed DNA polymerase
MSVERRGPTVCNGSNKMEGKGEMTKAPSSLQDLRRSLYVKAKAEPAWRFWGLYVHVCKMETLQEAYQMAKANDGAPGIDGVTFETIEEGGVEGFLRQIRDELITNTYRPMRARKKEIPKDGGKKVRVLSIPSIRDRVVQGALKLILEPIFEADFQSGSYGYRPKRTAHQAVNRVAQAIVESKTRIIDLDLRAYLDSYLQCSYGSSKRPGGGSNTLIRKPLRCPCRTWRASSSPLFTRCHKVCRDTPSRRMASTTGT